MAASSAATTTTRMVNVQFVDDEGASVSLRVPAFAVRAEGGVVYDATLQASDQRRTRTEAEACAHDDACDAAIVRSMVCDKPELTDAEKDARSDADADDEDPFEAFEDYGYKSDFDDDGHGRDDEDDACSDAMLLQHIGMIQDGLRAQWGRRAENVLKVWIADAWDVILKRAVKCLGRAMARAAARCDDFDETSARVRVECVNGSAREAAKAFVFGAFVANLDDAELHDAGLVGARLKTWLGSAERHARAIDRVHLLHWLGMRTTRPWAAALMNVGRLTHWVVNAPARCDPIEALACGLFADVHASGERPAALVRRGRATNEAFFYGTVIARTLVLNYDSEKSRRFRESPGEFLVGGLPNPRTCRADTVIHSPLVPMTPDIARDAQRDVACALRHDSARALEWLARTGLVVATPALWRAAVTRRCAETSRALWRILGEDQWPRARREAELRHALARVVAADPRFAFQCMRDCVTFSGGDGDAAVRQWVLGQRGGRSPILRKLMGARAVTAMAETAVTAAAGGGCIWDDLVPLLATGGPEGPAGPDGPWSDASVRAWIVRVAVHDERWDFIAWLLRQASIAATIHEDFVKTVAECLADTDDWLATPRRTATATAAAAAAATTTPTPVQASVQSLFLLKNLKAAWRATIEAPIECERHRGLLHSAWHSAWHTSGGDRAFAQIADFTKAFMPAVVAAAAKKPSEARALACAFTSPITACLEWLREHEVCANVSRDALARVWFSKTAGAPSSALVLFEPVWDWLWANQDSFAEGSEASWSDQRANRALWIEWNGTKNVAAIQWIATRAIRIGREEDYVALRFCRALMDPNKADRARILRQVVGLRAASGDASWARRAAWGMWERAVPSEAEQDEVIDGSARELLQAAIAPQAHMYNFDPRGGGEARFILKSDGDVAHAKRCAWFLWTELLRRRTRTEDETPSPRHAHAMVNAVARVSEAMARWRGAYDADSRVPPLLQWMWQRLLRDSKLYWETPSQFVGLATNVVLAPWSDAVRREAMSEARFVELADALTGAWRVPSMDCVCGGAVQVAFTDESASSFKLSLGAIASQQDPTVRAMVREAVRVVCNRLDANEAARQRTWRGMSADTMWTHSHSAADKVVFLTTRERLLAAARAWIGPEAANLGRVVIEREPVSVLFDRDDHEAADSEADDEAAGGGGAADDDVSETADSEADADDDSEDFVAFAKPFANVTGRSGHSKP